MNLIYEQIIHDIVAKHPKNDREFFAILRRSMARHKIPPPAKSTLLKAYHKLVRSGKIKLNRAKGGQAKQIEQLLTKRAVRTLSGVAVISVLTKPSDCPGNCLFCPTEKNMPKSYLSNEPAVMRAIANDFDPYKQVKMRLEALKANGHSTEKVELIIMGGTWSHHDPKYQDWFIKRCFDAVNGKTSKTLKSAQKINESAKQRIIGLTLETRPDYINVKEISRMRELGCTRVELGVQHIDDRILKLNRRGHTAKQSIEAIKLLKDASFKINLHIIPNLYGSTPAKDLAMFKKIYSDGNWMPDMVKIYPCVVNEHADLYKIYKQKKYKPYTQKQLIDLIVKIKKITPPWVRIARLIRDIPEESIIAGNKTTNLRQLIANESNKSGWSCKCIRCREAGHADKVGKIKVKSQKLKVIKYRASNGIEYFLSYESPDEKILYAFLRLRIPENSTNNPFAELRGAALIRELHTYGQATDIGDKGEVQHLGLGKKLLIEAEKITRQNGLNKIAVISGIGVRSYYKKFGYQLEGTYMVKDLT